MFYYKYSADRIFFLNEYWILIPITLTIDYFIVRKILKDKKKAKQIEMLKKQLEMLTKQLEREKKLKKIMLLSLGLNQCLHFLARGGSNPLINTDYIQALCSIEEGVRYLGHNRLRNIIIHLYRHKRRDQIIYITGTALCYLADRYGKMFIAFPFAVGDYGLTNAYQIFRKTFIMSLFGGAVPLLAIGSPVALTVALMLGMSGLRLAFTNLDFIPSSPIDIMKDLEPRILGISDVVVINNQNKFIMREPAQENKECWLPEQNLLNPNCKVKPTQIPDAIDSVLPDLKYDHTVNMQDVTGLDRIDFTDIFDLGRPKSSTCNPRKGKEVGFLQKFKDSRPIGENDGWEICDNEFIVPEKRYLRTRNKP